MSSDEEDIRRPGRSGAHSPVESDAHNSGNENLSGENMDEDNDADLFGSDGEEGGLEDERPNRTLDDEALDSGDDEDRYDRRDRMEDDLDDVDDHTVNIMDVNLARAPVPATNDGLVYTMRVPDFLTIEAEEFNPETYVAPPYSTAATSLCWRRDQASDTLQSNARIVQWEDGSLTLQLASAPLEQYRIATKPLAPLSRAGEYDTKLDSHVYLGAAVETSSLFRLTSHVTHGITVLPTTHETDDAVQKLQESLAAAARGNKKTLDGSAPVIETTEDPEAAAKRAERAEKDSIRLQRRQEALAEREADRGRRPPHRTLGTGLSLGNLEGDGMSTTRPRAKRRPNRRGEIYSDEEEDYGGRGARTREDEYDEDDGFLVGSDEDVEEGEEGEEEEELEDDDMDAEGEVDDEVAPAKPSLKNRYIVEDDDEDE
ncbi:hypothetical protein N7470_007415 [Penicillium chermesinum]|nr:hypothetical protein N7470_007415 [Penicillium chermesinum]